MVFVTRPVLPSFLRYLVLASSIWRSRLLTNNGPNCKYFSCSLKKYLSANNLILTNNGTSALQVALSSLSLPSGGEVITTPYSFVATSNAIVGASLKPIFVDIARDSFNICPLEIEKAITPNTKAILPVHVYGIPANLESIENLARKYNLPVVYDAAHSFGVTINGKSLLSFGDLSTCSFHATKVFNTGEGGCIVQNSYFDSSLDKLINFGFCSENDIDCFGTNAKMSEFSAVLGRLNLDSFPHVLKSRYRVFNYYLEYLNPSLIHPEILSHVNSDNFNWNCSYMPIKLGTSIDSHLRDLVYSKLLASDIYSRKYFYPLICETSAYASMRSKWRQVGSLTNGLLASRTTLCLPIYPGLKRSTVQKISEIVNDTYERANCS